MVEIEREDLETLLQLAFENWEAKWAGWLGLPTADDMALILKMSKLSGNEDLMKKAQDKFDFALRGAEADAAMSRHLHRQQLEWGIGEVASMTKYVADAKEWLEKLQAIQGAQ